MRKLLSFTLIAITFLFSSCLKEKYDLGITDNTSRVLTEFTNGGAETLNSLSLDFGSGLVDVDVTEIRILPRSDARKDVQVKIVLNPTLVADYNTANGTSYEMPPSGIFLMPQATYTLTPSSKKTNIKIKVDPSAIPGNSYAIGFSIAEVSDGEISTIKKDYLVELKVKNNYEGTYHATGTLIRYNGPTTASPVAGTTIIDEDKFLATVDQNTCDAEMGAIAFTGGYMFLEVDPATNIVTVGPSFISPTFPTTAGNGTSTYDPATGTFTLKYKYFNGVGNLREIQEVLVRL